MVDFFAILVDFAKMVIFFSNAILVIFANSGCNRGIYLFMPLTRNGGPGGYAVSLLKASNILINMLSIILEIIYAMGTV